MRRLQRDSRSKPLRRQVTAWRWCWTMQFQLPGQVQGNCRLGKTLAKLQGEGQTFRSMADSQHAVQPHIERTHHLHRPVESRSLVDFGGCGRSEYLTAQATDDFEGRAVRKLRTFRSLKPEAYRWVVRRFLNTKLRPRIHGKSLQNSVAVNSIVRR